MKKRRRQKRDAIISMRIVQPEKDVYQAAAERCDQSLSAWIRSAAKAAIKRGSR